MDGTKFLRTESIGVRSVSVLTSNNLKSQFLIQVFLQRNTSRNAEEIAEINEIVELKGLGF